MITAEQFKLATGYEPANDDLERCNCPQAGELGHWQCGWCEVKNRPRFMCGCMDCLRKMRLEPGE